MSRIGMMTLSAMLALGTAACGDDDATPTDAGPGGMVDSGPGGDVDAGPGGDMDAGPGGGAGDFTLSLMGYDPHVTQQLGIVVIRESDSMVVGNLTDTVDAAATSKTIDAIIEDGVAYTVQWYADLDGNTMCDAPPTDHAWEMTGQMGTAAGLTVDHTHDTMWTDVCASFGGSMMMGGDFTLTLRGYRPHVTQQLGIHVMDESDGSTAGMLIDTVDGAMTSKTIVGIIQDGTSYTVRWYADLSGNSMCDAPPTDHAWEMTGQMGTASGLTITHPHDTMWTDVCAQF